MTERLHVVPEELRRSAGEHRQAAELLAAAPSANAAVLASLESLGPVFAELRDAGRALLDQRRACYEQQAAAHADLAERLNLAADAWEQHDADAARRLRAVTEDSP
ncbi:ESX-1 secretion-associated protein [Mycolicibacterium sp.]|uniref:ESX-1 secretion-associated protein n=1 Tax=Mycolicibacterium sp. TaxID=2320850 RepID=UPI001D80695E|nr:ESX-1 secretion-associated protein [Mycolicibacterium sp.]MCB1292384.1 ESX-1 secretion-associated protein [Mycobacterium sp.]MCB9410056.1 ESX-1 secretion-associated protein [Mycolicibacterium sp.]